MALMNEAAKARLLAKQKEIREKMANSSFTKSWTLNGKNAIAAPGESKTARFGPRWDFAIKSADGKLSKNPDYDPTAEIHVGAIEHWWDGEGGKTQHAWCPKSLDSSIDCPICEAAETLSKSDNEDDRKLAKRIGPKEVFIFNAVIDRPRRTADGKADFRIMSVSRSIFDLIVDIITGGADEAYARGNIGDPVEGYDIKLSRPAQGKGGGDRWKVDCAPKPSPLYDDAQKAAFKDWPGMLINLEEMLQKETKTPLELFKAFYGRDPEGDEIGAGEKPAEKSAAKDAPEAQASEPESAEAPDMTDEFLTPSTNQAPKVATPPAKGPKTGGRR